MGKDLKDYFLGERHREIEIPISHPGGNPTVGIPLHPSLRAPFLFCIPMIPNRVSLVVAVGFTYNVVGV
jgi:hypothetical protein